MFNLAMFKRMFAYSDWANLTVLKAAEPLTDAQLDLPQEIGPQPGSLRRILVHTVAGETVWLSRWRGNVETPWPNERTATQIGELRTTLQSAWATRAQFFDTLADGRLSTVQVYRDSRGNLFKATLGDMLLQGYQHSAHHRAQAANAIRRTGGTAPELDYMNHVRIPAE